MERRLPLLYVPCSAWLPLPRLRAELGEVSARKPTIYPWEVCSRIAINWAGYWEKWIGITYLGGTRCSSGRWL